MTDDLQESGIPCPWCKASDAVVKNGIYCCRRCGYEADIRAPQQIRVIGWVTGKDNDYPSIPCRTAAIYDAIVREVKEKGYSFSWASHQSDPLPCTPVINNGCKIHCSPSTWGAIMADAHATGNTYDAVCAEYAYGFVEDPVYPRKYVDREQIVPFEITE